MELQSVPQTVQYRAVSEALMWGKLKLSNFQTPRNSPAILFLVSEMTLQAGSQVIIFLDVTKS